jgi:hypothetical protein
MRLTQIEVTLNSPPRLIFKHAPARKFIDVPAFGRDQKEINLVAKLRALSVAIVAVTSKVRALEPVVVVRPERLNDVFNEIALGGKPIKALDCCLDPLPPGLVFLDCIRVPL